MTSVIDRDVSTVYRRPSPGDNVDLLSGTICTSVITSEWCINPLRESNHGSLFQDEVPTYLRF